MENILVSGGAGYIGSHIVRDLIDSGKNPVILDNLSLGNKDMLLGGDFIQGDVADVDLVQSIIKKYKIESIIHFAAFIQVEESVSNPFKYYENNFYKAMKFINTAVDSGVKNIVFSSTAAVYGMPDENPVTEQTPLAPINPYGRSKVFTENFLKDLAQINDEISFVILRYFNVAGADCKCRIGQKYKKATHLITLALHAALGIRENLKIFGTDYDTPDGTAIRDYIHVDDLSNAHLLALQYLKDKGKSRIFNCGYGHGYSVKDVVASAKRVTGIDFEVIDSERRAGDSHCLVADSGLLRKILGWQPQSDDLDHIIDTAWQWEKKIRT